MKSTFKPLALISLLILSGSAIAEQAHHQMPKQDGKNMSHDMSSMSSEHLAGMQAHMLTMHELSNKILTEKDPQKQQALKNQQLELMKAHHMQMMSMHGGKAMQHDKDPAKINEHLKKKQAHELMMHELSNKILAEKNPQKQQALKNQQLEMMKAHHQKKHAMHHNKK